MPEPDAEVFRALYTACTHKCAVRMQAAKQGVFPMTFSPHALVQVPGCVHFRGYAQWAAGQEKGMFIDLVPARVESIDDKMIWDAVPSSEDADWHSKVKCGLSPVFGVARGARGGTEAGMGVIHDRQQSA